MTFEIDHSQLDQLKAIASRADWQGEVELTPRELRFALTLEGRRLLDRADVNQQRFRVSAEGRRLIS